MKGVPNRAAGVEVDQIRLDKHAPAPPAPHSPGVHLLPFSSQPSRPRAGAEDERVGEGVGGGSGGNHCFVQLDGPARGVAASVASDDLVPDDGAGALGAGEGSLGVEETAGGDVEGHELGEHEAFVGEAIDDNLSVNLEGVPGRVAAPQDGEEGLLQRSRLVGGKGGSSEEHLTYLFIYFEGRKKGSGSFYFKSNGKRC